MSINVLDFSICTQPKCKCGWNIKLGGESQEALNDIKQVLKKHGYKDLTDYSQKITARPDILIEWINGQEKGS